MLMKVISGGQTGVDQAALRAAAACGAICLNVAGNSERTSPGIGDAAEVFLRRVFVELIEHEPALARTGLLERLPVQGDA